jgi:hypothetical protein
MTIRVPLKPKESSKYLIPAFYYDIFGYIKGGQFVSDVLTVLANYGYAGVDHWYSAYYDNARVQFYDKIYGLDLAVVDMHDLGSTHLEEHTDWHHDYNNEDTIGYQGEFLYTFDGISNYKVRAWGKVMYRAQTENGNGITYDVYSSYPTINHTINTQ